MTAPQNPRVTQADEERADALDNDLGFLMENERAILLEHLVAHREAAEAASKAREAALVEALKKARKIIRDVEDYMARPDRGDWGVECALCMGELFDDDQEAIAAIDAALTKEPDA